VGNNADIAGMVQPPCLTVKTNRRLAKATDKQLARHTLNMRDGTSAKLIRVGSAPETGRANTQPSRPRWAMIDICCFAATIGLVTCREFYHRLGEHGRDRT
jgi:hypothetical protein